MLDKLLSNKKPRLGGTIRYKFIGFAFITGGLSFYQYKQLRNN